MNFTALPYLLVYLKQIDIKCGSLKFRLPLFPKFKSQLMTSPYSASPKFLSGPVNVHN